MAASSGGGSSGRRGKRGAQNQEGGKDKRVRIMTPEGAQEEGEDTTAPVEMLPNGTPKSMFFLFSRFETAFLNSWLILL